MKFLLIILTALFFSACGSMEHSEHHANHHGDHDAKDGSGMVCKDKEKNPKGVYFISPTDGETVSGKFTVRFGANGMMVRPASDMTEGTGHHHLIIDGMPTEKGTTVPKDDTNLHFGKGQGETELTLSPGQHTLTLQFADGAHSSYGEEWSKTISVIVK